MLRTFSNFYKQHQNTFEKLFLTIKNYLKIEEFFYPPPDSQFSKWLQNFTPKAITLAATIGYTTAETDKLTLITNALVFCDGRSTNYDAGRLEFIRTRQIILYGDETNPVLANVEYEPQVAVITVPAEAPANVRAFINNLVQRARLCPTLDVNKKKEMGVLPKPRPESEPQANIKGTVVNGVPVLEVKLYGYPAFELWRSLTGQNEFSLLSLVIGTTYTDDSPLPPGQTAVQYDYKMRIIGVDNEQITGFSDIVTLTKTA